METAFSYNSTKRTPAAPTFGRSPSACCPKSAESALPFCKYARRS